MARRDKITPSLDLTQMPNITPGTWVFVPGDKGDDSVGLSGYAPTVEVEIPGREGDFCELAEICEPIYQARPEDMKNSDMDYEHDSGDRYLPGNPNANGLLMAGSKGLLVACQEELQELYNDREHNCLLGLHEGSISEVLYCERIEKRILALETAIKQAIVFPE